MIPSIKKLLCDALASDKYKLVTGSLRTGEDGYCVLGVICELYRTTVPGSEQWVKQGDLYTYCGKLITLPTPVGYWSDLIHDRLPDMRKGSHGEEIPAQLVLAQLVDELGYSFADVAKFIQHSSL